MGINLLAGTVVVSNVLLLIWYYAVPAEIQKQVPTIIKTFFPIIAVFPKEVFDGLLRAFVEMRLFWIVTLTLSAVGIFFLNKLARTVFIVFNIIHIVTLTYVVTLKLGGPDFLDYFFKLYFNIVAVLTYVGFLTLLETRGQFQIVTKESWLSLWLKKINLVSHGPGPGHAGAYYNLGLAYSRLERYDDAIDLLKKAIAMNPQEADVHFQLALIYIKQRKYSAAINSLKEAVRIDPFHVEAYANLGLAYQKEGCAPEAIRVLEKAVHMKQGSAAVSRNLGDAYYSAGKHKEALEAYREAARLNPQDDQVAYQIGVIFNHLEKFSEAKEALQKAVRLNPGIPDAHFQLGLACLKLNLPKDAIRAFKDVLRLEPNHKQGHYQLGVAYATIGDADSAQRECRDLTELDPDLAENLKMFIK